MTMNREYIDREVVSEGIRKYYYKNPPNSSYQEGFDYGLDKAQRVILDAPAADVVEVRHGRWERVIPTKSAAKWSTKVSCSKCHSVGYMRYNYCPNCGSLMDKEEPNEL